MFDWVETKVKGGEGGDGSISFRHEKFVPFGGPDGGNGGAGGDVILRADSSIGSLLGFRHRKFYRAGDGKNGRGKRMHGKSGGDSMLLVPPGTVVNQKTSDGSTETIADLEMPGQQEVVARGGRGGLGNTHYASSTNQAPQIAQRGEPGEEKRLILEMRLIADVGIIGYPNVGKSTLLAAASAAKPKIASYPFTTLEPELGVVAVGKQSFVMADIPGLIEGAHLGRGLGHDFLRHIMRTRMLIHLLDGSSEDPLRDMTHVNEELSLFDLALAREPQLVVINKIDLPEVQEQLDLLRFSFSDFGIRAYFISAETGQGAAEVMAEAMTVLGRLKTERETVRVSRKVFRPQPKRGISIHREEDAFVILVPELERLRTRDGTVSDELRWYLRHQLSRMGVSKSLEKAGIKPGDRVRCGNLEWDW